MDQKIDAKALKRWEKSQISYKNYQDYIARKSDHFHLRLIDLLYISNFKGGNSTINEEEDITNQKLGAYSEKLRIINGLFQNRKLADLNEFEIDTLIKVVEDICALTYKDSNNKIDGFSVSYLSALLSAYFMDLVPILDRRVLINMNLVSREDLNSQKQVKNIERFFDPLIKKVHELSKEKGYSIRAIDKDFFKVKLPNWI